MTPSHPVRPLLGALLGLIASTGSACMPAAYPEEPYDPQACAEDALRRTADRALASQVAEQASQFCAMGDAGMCSLLGVAYEVGMGVKRDRDLALSLYRTACTRRNARACGNEGELLLSEGPPGRPLALLRLSCEAGHARHCAALGRVYAEGTVVPRAPAYAWAWLERACERGDGPSCVRLVDLGVHPARTSALLTKACMRGDGEGCTRLSQR